MPDFGEFYTVPVILSFRDTAKQADKELGGKFGALGKKAGGDFGKEFAGASEVEVKKSLETYKRLTDKAADAAGKLRTEEQKLQELRDKGVTGGSRFIAQEERTAKARRDSARAAKEAKIAEDDYQRAQRDLAGGASSATGALGALSRGFGGVASAAAGIGLAGVAAGVTAVGAAAVVAGRQLYDLGASFDDAFDSLKVKTGASGADLAGLQQVVRDLAKEVPVSMDVLADVAAESSRALHLTGTELEQVSKTIANLNRITGEQTNMRDLGKAFRAFGVDAKDQEAALNQLYTATTETSLGVNDLLGSLTKGTAGPALRALGLDFGQAAALITSFEVAGLDGDKMLAGLTKSLAQFAKDGQSAPQALRDTVAQMKSLIAAGDDIGAQNIANKLFGAKGGIQFFDAVKRGSLDLESLTKSLDGTVLSINDVAASTDDGAESLQLLRNKLELALEPLGSTIFDEASEKIDELATWIDTHQPEIIEAVVEIGDAFGAVAQDALLSFGQIIEALGDVLNVVGDTVGGILKAGAAIDDFFGRDDKAAEQRQQAEYFFNLGESTRDLGRIMQDTAPKIGEYREKWREAGREMADAARKSDELDTGLGKLAGRRFEVAISVVPRLPNGTVVNGPTDLFPQLGGAVDGSAGVVPRLDSSGLPAPGTFGGGGGPGGARGGFPNAPILGGGGSSGGGSWITSPGGSSSGTNWDAIAQAESSGNWSDNNSGGHSTSSGAPRGGLQITDGTWAAYGGKEFAPTANLATREQQIAVAERIAFTGYRGTPPQGLQAWEAVTKGMVPGITANSGPAPTVTSASMPADFGASAGRPTAPPPDENTLRAWVQQNFGIPNTFGTGSWENAAHDADGGWHHNLTHDMSQPGYGFDFHGTPEQMATLANWVAQNFAKDTLELIYQGPGFDPGNLIKNGQFGDVYGPGLLAQHTDHVHWALANAPYAAGAGAGAPYTTMSAAAGTPGYNEDGEPGYWVPDPKKIRQAEQRIADADQRVREADASVAQAEARIRELDADAEESQKLSAQAQLDRAQYDAQVARREADDARTDAGDARRGDFKPAKKPSKQSGQQGQNGMGDLSPLGQIAGSFLKETFGFDGSWLPDLASLAPVQMAGTLMSAFSGPLMGALQGKLGVQQPGWRPGDPLPDELFSDNATSSGPFGIPDVAAPPMPPSGQHGGSGAAPGPTIYQTVDQSQNFTNSSLGWDPAEVNRQRDRDQRRRTIPRIPVGAGP